MRTALQKIVLTSFLILPISAWSISATSMQKNDPANAAAISLYEQGITAMEKKEFEAAEKTGVAAIAIEGKLVDYAMYQRAKRVLELAKLN